MNGIKHLLLLLSFCGLSSKLYGQEHFIDTHKYMVGAEYGVYLYSQGNIGIDLDKGNGVMYGANFVYILSKNTILNAGLQKVDFNYLKGEQFYRIPISLSYALCKRGHARSFVSPVNINNVLFFFISMGFLPQTFELGDILSLGIYDKFYTKKYRKKDDVFILKPGQTLDDVPTNKLSDITRRNHQVVPSIDLGLRWTFDFKSVHFTIHPKYSYLLVEDNIIQKVNVETQILNRQSTRSAFGILWYSF